MGAIITVILIIIFFGQMTQIGFYENQKRSDARKNGKNTYWDDKGIERSVKTGNVVVPHTTDDGMYFTRIDYNTKEVLAKVETEKGGRYRRYNKWKAEKDAVNKENRDEAIRLGKPYYQHWIVYITNHNTCEFDFKLVEKDVETGKTLLNHRKVEERKVEQLIDENKEVIREVPIYKYCLYSVEDDHKIGHDPFWTYNDELAQIRCNDWNSNFKDDGKYKHLIAYVKKIED